MAAHVVAMLPTVVRAIAKPKVFKRFLGTKAGKRAMLKSGTMLLRSKSVQNTLSKFVSKNDKQMAGNKEYEEYKKKYEQLQKRIAELEKQLDAARDNQSQMETLTFTLGRQVVQMQQLLQDMQQQQNEYVKQMLNAQHTR
ncbi:MAG: hypothetical protein IKB59_00230 [Alphaproteobacteria bacterium]|nr:hypothetical protein [Alphaproteobacteria bacterium]